MFLGRIITKNKTFKPLDFIEKTSELVVDNTIPTLIIGRDNAEEIYGKEKIRVLNKQIEPNVYWTFRKTERRVDYEDNLNLFYERIKKYLNTKVEYVYYNIFTEENERTIKFIDWLYNGKKKYVYIHNEHLYIYSGGKKVIGLSLRDIEYIGKDKQKVIGKIKNNPNNIVIENKDFISFEFLQLIGDNEKFIPYLYFLTKE